MSEDRFYFNGINGATGAYLLEPRTPEELAREFIRGAKPPENKDELKARSDSKNQGFLGVVDGVDPEDLAQAGWGIIFAQSDAHTPAILDALKELLDLRRGQAGELYREYHGERGVAAGENKTAWQARMDVGPGPAVPRKMPYYLMIVGDPEAIPYRFQYQLDVTYAVGRLHFDTLGEYAQYARSVALAESGKVALARRANFFAVQNYGDPATAQGAKMLVEPLAALMAAAQPGWMVDLTAPADATKQRLSQLLGGAATPALLFTESHGMYFPPGDPRHIRDGGALLCNEWIPSPGPISENHYLSACDIGADARLHGLIAFNFACFSAGTPMLDDFSHATKKRGQIASRSFVAGLPQKLLGHPAGGALAAIGHIERAFPSSFVWNGASQLSTFQSALNKLMRGAPVGFAVEDFNDRYSELSTVLSQELEDMEFGDQKDPAEVSGIWMANNDARNYAVVGDPAVRLPLGDNGADGERATIAPVEIRSPASKDGATTDSAAAVAPAAAPAKQTTATAGGHATQTQGAGSGSLFGQIGQMRPFTPWPTVPPEVDKEKHPELYKAWVDHIRTGYRNGDTLFTRILNAFMRSHYSSVLMYWVLFAVGVSAFVAGIVIALVRGEAVVGLAFAGLGVVAFLTYFISFPTQAVEENLLFVTWLGVLYNSYWKHLSLSFDVNTAQGELDKATEDAIRQLKDLISTHAKAVRSRPRPLSRRKPDAANGGDEA